jgi:hypothetical protein
VEGTAVRRIQRRERPEPSTAWLASAFAFLTTAAGTATGSLTLSSGAAVRPLDLWIATAGLLVTAALCFLAHWDVNRGRKAKRYEIEELLASEAMEGPQAGPPS